MKKMYPVWVVIGIGMFVLAIVFAGAPVSLYLSLPALIVVVLPPVFLTLGSFGWTGFWRSFRIAFEGVSATRLELKTGVKLFGALRRFLLLTGIITTMIGLIAMLSSLNQPDEIGHVVALALITLFYSLNLIFFVAIPFSAALKTRLLVATEESPE